MGKIRITSYGHSCFKISTESGAVILDPYEDGKVPGLVLPENLEADAVYCSHQHADHNAAHLVRLSGKGEPFKVSFLTVPHDHHGGSRRGMNRITFLQVEGICIAHLGDLGRLPTDEEYESLRKADIVMLPCAGYFTISSEEAREVIQQLKKPSLKILMHFRDGKRGYEVQEDIRDIMKVIPGVKRLPVSELEIDPDRLPHSVVTLEPAV